MLVCAFAGRDACWRPTGLPSRQRYRFYSYGDAMLVV